MAVRIILLNRAVSNDRPYFIFRSFIFRSVRFHITKCASLAPRLSIFICGSVRVHIAGGIWQAIYV